MSDDLDKLGIQDNEGPFDSDEIDRLAKIDDDPDCQNYPHADGIEGGAIEQEMQEMDEPFNEEEEYDPFEDNRDVLLYLANLLFVAGMKGSPKLINGLVNDPGFQYISILIRNQLSPTGSDQAMNLTDMLSELLDMDE